MAVVRDYNVAVIRRFLELGAESMRFGDDLGMQRALPISPALWRRALKPCFAAMFGPCREAGALVYLHSDGHILEIIPDLIEVGVTVLNPQLSANGIEGLLKMGQGRVALDVDLNRQLFPFASPAQIEEHIGQAWEAFHAPEGGLMLRAECQPDVPLENIEAICRTLQRLCHPPAQD